MYNFGSSRVNNKKMVNFTPAGHDTTEKKQTEETLKESEDKYKQIFNNLISALMYCQPIFDENEKPVDYKVLDVNPAYERITGLKRADMVGRLATEIGTVLDNQLSDILESIANTALTQKVNHFEKYFKRANKWLDITLYCPQRGYTVANISDITERKMSEESTFSFNAILMQTAESKELKNVSDGDFSTMTITKSSALFVEDDYVSGVVMKKLCERKNINLKIATCGYLSY